jgi:phosphoglycerate kinase
MRGINQIENLKGKRVLVRVDFNLPLKDGQVEDVFRIKKALPTINFLQKGGARIILITHLGKGGDSLAPVAEALNGFIPAKFIPQIVGQEVKNAVDEMQDGEVILLENLRNNEGEQACDMSFATALAASGEVYVNEAFPVDHREDASIILLPKILPAYAGLQLEEEVKNLSHAFKEPKHPFLFILGGAKFSTKLPLIQKYLELADHVCVGGALANDFLKAKGYEVGRSLVSEDRYGIQEILKNEKLVLPEDVVVKKGEEMIEKGVGEVLPDEIILDLGKKTEEKINSLINQSQIILWNGPLGKYESGGAQVTKDILKTVAASKAESIIGGGDTVALISELGLENNFSFISTGGGATLDFLAKGTLPGIEALSS